MAVRLTVVGAVRRELDALPADLATSGLAATAVAMAREVDNAKNSATSKSMCARVLSDVLGELRGLKPPAEETDALDDLTAQRLRRRGAVS